MAVDRCICKNVPFSEALLLARKHSCATVAQLQAFTPLGTNCGRCIPYMQLALLTGRDDLPVLDDATQQQLRAAAGVPDVGGRG
ncbi:MAG: (2Fe-2S)-binding protein [Armatimonadetes bacterium]|nr:(2Fe-2S)-binding protein [Armatimonadota bacterium]